MSDIVDDEDIANNVMLWRRIPPDQLTNDSDGNPRPSSKAFQDSNPEYHNKVMKPLGYNHPPGMSVDIAEETTIEAIENVSPNDLIVEFTAGFARGLDQKIIRAPIPGNDAHAEVMGKKTKSKKKAFAKSCIWVKGP